jgi:uncharacterized protein (TIGR03437 family)
LDINFVVKPVGSVANSGAAARAAAGCTPSTLVLSETGLVDNFSVPAGWPAILTAQVLDDCGNSVPGASVAAAFSNGDPPVALAGDTQNGLYAATWQPTTAASRMTITLAASSSQGLAPAKTQITGDVNANSAPAPSQVIAGLLNNFSPQVGAGLAPGTVTQAYGDNLATVSMATNTAPLPTSFNGVQVIVSGRPAGIYYVSKNQLTIQIPSELPVNKPAQIVLLAGNAVTLPQEIFLNQFAPGVLAFADGTLVAQHGANPLQLVDATHPAKPGEVLVAYLVGMGATNPAVPSSVASPANPPAVVPGGAQVTVGGQTALVSFVGLTPGFVGLYQLNFAVPQNAQPGMLDVVISQGSINANTTKLIVGN